MNAWEIWLPAAWMEAAAVIGFNPARAANKPDVAVVMCAP
ncbi:hypothetical protein SBV1_930014 [Verrucomicrobia bacterium]|nr:hypothetical protein SBV1_930014 [Verrucomicrobiota bacterium]